MASSVWSAIGVDKESLAGKLIAVEEHHGSDGNFVLCCLVAKEVQKESGLCLVALHNSFGHYHNVGTKLGYNLSQLQEKGYVETVEVLKLVNRSLNTREDKTLDFLSGDKENIVKNLFYMIKEKVDKLFLVRNSVMIVMDDLSDLLSLGISVKDVSSFVQYCRTLLESYPQLSIVILTHVIEVDEDQNLLSAGICHVADVTIIISGLKTGHSSDVSGSLKVIHRNWDKLNEVKAWNKQNLYHFKLLDRQVKIFAPGTAPSLT